MRGGKELRAILSLSLSHEKKIWCIQSTLFYPILYEPEHRSNSQWCHPLPRRPWSGWSRPQCQGLYGHWLACESPCWEWHPLHREENTIRVRGKGGGGGSEREGAVKEEKKEENRARKWTNTHHIPAPPLQLLLLLWLLFWCPGWVWCWQWQSLPGRAQRWPVAGWRTTHSDSAEKKAKLQLILSKNESQTKTFFFSFF